MKTKPTAIRRKFDSERDEMEYLYHKLLYWLYEREAPAHARVFADRLDQLLSKTSAGHDAIFPEECRSLICEARGDVRGAIKHRETEIHLIKRLHEISHDSAQKKDIFRLHGYDDLSDRLDLLAVLYHAEHDLDRALAALRESKRVCESKGLTFDGEDLLRQYLCEKKDIEMASESSFINRRKKTAS